MGYGSYAAGASRVNEYSWKENYYTTNIYTDYFKEFDNGHYFKVMAGFNAELYKTRSIEAQKNTLLSPDIPTLGTATKDPAVGGGYDHHSVAGFFARVNWSYKDRYMFEANGRYDGSSRFIGSKQWGFFPSFSAGWNIANEEFFKDIAEKIQLGSLKLRGSWGQLGNTRTNSLYPFFMSMPAYSNYSWLINGNRPNYAYNPGMVSSSLTWETIETLDFGLDWSFFQNRLTGSFDYFVRKTSDMVGPAPELSNALGTGVPNINNTDMKSYGWELEIGWKDKIGDFSYGVKAVLSDDQQKVTNYPNPTNTLTANWYNGEVLGEIWGYQTIGIAQSDKEMQDHLNSLPNGGQSSLGSGWGAGDIMYADINNDGKVDKGNNRVGDSGDYQIIGNSTPRYKFGITLDAAYKGWDFRMFLQGVAKRDLMLGGNYFWGATGQGNEWQTAGFEEHWDFWRPEGDPLGANLDAYYPKVNFSGGRNTATQTRYLQNGAYMRVKNIQVGYTFPKSWIEKVGMSNLRMYVSADNLFTFTSLSKIYDPEQAGVSTGGKLYPLQRVVSVGVNVNF
jgi:TonB-linked SusC/RagA family outer membrane protein